MTNSEYTTAVAGVAAELDAKVAANEMSQADRDIAFLEAVRGINEKNIVVPDGFYDDSPVKEDVEEAT